MLFENVLSFVLPFFRFVGDRKKEKSHSVVDHGSSVWVEVNNGGETTMHYLMKYSTLNFMIMLNVAH